MQCMWALVYVKFDYETANELRVHFLHARVIDTLNKPWLLPH